MTTTRPGPYSLLIEPGAQRGTSRVLINSTPVQIAAASEWSAIPCPDTTSPIDVEIIPEPSASIPALIIHAAADPLRITSSPEGLILSQHGPTIPMHNPGSMQQIVLPRFAADAIHVVFRSDTILPPADKLIVTLNDADSELQLTSDNKSYRKTIRTHLDGTSVKLTISVSEGALPNTFELILQPLFRKLTCEPRQTGVYVFDAFDESSETVTTIARSLDQSKNSSVSSAGLWIGGCRRFLSPGTSLRSQLTSDAVFEFSGFSDREVARKAVPTHQRWTSATNATVRLTAPPWTKCELSISLLSSCPPEAAPAEVYVQIADTIIPVTFTEGRWSATHEFMSNADDRGNMIQLNSRLWTPADYPPSRDSRALGVLLDSLVVTFHP